jgi:hypothetical protein
MRRVLESRREVAGRSVGECGGHGRAGPEVGRHRGRLPASEGEEQSQDGGQSEKQPRRQEDERERAEASLRTLA